MFQLAPDQDAQTVKMSKIELWLEVSMFLIISFITMCELWKKGLFPGSSSPIIDIIISMIK